MTKTVYKVQNWATYNKSLVARGSINLWISDDVADQWYDATYRCGKGCSRTYSDHAIELCLTFRSLYRLPLRAVQGFVQSLLSHLGIGLCAPDYSTLSRRQKAVSPALSRTRHGGAIDIVLDSTGLKLYGDGEWNVRQHGVSKRRTWRKLHLAIDPLDHEIVSQVLTTNDVGDSSAFVELVQGVHGDITRIFADGAYDRQPCYEHCDAITATPVIPLREDAVCGPPSDRRKGREPRRRILERLATLQRTMIPEEARKQWKIESDYHTRSLAETAMFRFKTLFGDTLAARNIQNQKVEIALKSKILNRFTQIGLPLSSPVIT